MPPNKLTMAVIGLRGGNTADERTILKELNWLTAVFVTQMKARHGRVFSAGELRRDVRESIIESAVMCVDSPEVWSQIPRRVMRDIDTRITDRVKLVSDFRKKVTFGVGGSNLSAPRTMSPNLSDCLSRYTPQGDIDVLYMKSRGATFRAIAKELGVSCTRVARRFKRCIQRLKREV